MQIQLHKNATTTPNVRERIQQSNEPISLLARRFSIQENTVRKWKNRKTTEDESCCPHTLQTTLTPAQESIVVELRRFLLLALDDLLPRVRQYINPAASRSGLHRTFVRHGVSRLTDLIPQEEGAKVPVKTFKEYKPGYLHVDIKYLPRMPDEAQHQYLYVAIDRATRWVFVEIHPDKGAKTAAGFLARLHAVAPMVITICLTDNGGEFTDAYCGGKREPSGGHAFDRQAVELNIEHRLTKPRHPQTNGMVERFNGRIAAILSTTRFASAAEMSATLAGYVGNYNVHHTQKALDYRAPQAAIQAWQETNTECFRTATGTSSSITHNIMGLDK
jgi:transposase-like protein